MHRIFMGLCSVLFILVCSAVAFPPWGDGTNISAAPRLSRSTMISAGNDHTCAIQTSGLLKCWGANTTGQLGLGNTDTYGDSTDELGTGLPTVDVGQTVKYISGGREHTCAIRADDSTVCWEGYVEREGLGRGGERGGQRLPSEQRTTPRSEELV